MTETPTKSANPPSSEPLPEKEVPKMQGPTKQAFREQVWDHLEKNRLVTFPRPVHGRIPNFKGTEQAAQQLLQLEEFKSAKSIEVNPDKPLEYSRVLAIEHDKILYIPVPRLQEGLLKKLSFCSEDKPKNIKQSISRWGIETLGKSVDFDDNMHIDLLVVGSVAVSKDGRRIGKGKGYADLEFAILKEMKAVNDDTVIVTTVHDSQVFDTLPDEIFEKYDVPIDYILTPTQIIKVENKRPRPDGIYWELLSSRRVNLIPILQKLRELHKSGGRDTTLKQIDTDSESENKAIRPRSRRFSKRRSVTSSDRNEDNRAQSRDSAPRPRPRRPLRKSRMFRDRISNSESENVDKENEVNNKLPVKRSTAKWSRKNSRKLQVDFSVVVSNIDRNVRVRHLKDALINRGIKPNNITWRGYKGFCYLHYAKPSKKDDSEDVNSDNPIAVDNVIEILQALKLNPESGANLSVKVMEPTRFETTDVTAV